MTPTERLEDGHLLAELGQRRRRIKRDIGEADDDRYARVAELADISH